MIADGHKKNGGGIRGTLFLAIFIFAAIGTGKAAAETPPAPIVDWVTTIYWDGEYPAIIANLPINDTLDFYRLPADGAELELIHTYEYPSATFTKQGSVLRPGATPDEMFLWSDHNFLYHLDFNTTDVQRFRTNPLSLDLDTRTCITFPVLTPGSDIPIYRVSIDTQEEVLLSTVPSGAVGGLALKVFYPTGENEMITYGSNDVFPNIEKVYRINYSQAIATATYVRDGLLRETTPHDLDGDILKGVNGPAGLSGWRDLASDTYVRIIEIGQEFITATSLKFFFGEPYAEGEGYVLYTKIPVVIWENDYTTSSTTTLRIRHPDQDIPTSATLGIFY